MKKLVGILAAIFLVAFAIFDIAQDSHEILGIGTIVVLLTFGALMWALMSKLAHKHVGRDAGMPTNLAIWLHSGIEGALAAISFSFGFRAGMIVCLTLAIHILPECLAIMAALKQSGFSTKYALRTYAISLGILAASFSLIGMILPAGSELYLTILSTLVAGGFIFIAARTVRRGYLAD